MMAPRVVVYGLTMSSLEHGLHLPKEVQEQELVETQSGTTPTERSKVNFQSQTSATTKMWSLCFSVA